MSNQFKFSIKSLLLAALCSHAGIFQGTVLDKETGSAIQSVKVIAGQSIVYTDALGKFSVQNNSKAEVKLEHLSYEGLLFSFSFAKDSTAKIELSPAINRLKKSVVRRQLQGQARALNEEMNSDHFVNIIAADQMGRFADQNTAEALGRIPAVSIARDQGEGRYVQIRGTRPELTSVKINGQEVPSPEGDGRAVALDVIPSDQLSSIEVSKSLTPEMDADAIGGQVNLIMPKAKIGEPQYFMSLATSYIDLRNSFDNFDGMVGYGQRFNNEKLGVLFSAGYLRRHFGSDNVEKEFGSIDVLDSVLTWDEDEQDSIYAETDNSIDAYEEIQYRYYDIIRTRLSANLNLDYQLGSGSELYWMTTFNRFSDQEQRQRTVFDFGGDLYANDPNLVEGDVEKELKDRYEVQDIVMSTLGVKHQFGNTIWDYALSASYAQEDEPDAYYTTYKSGFDLEPITSLTNSPKVKTVGASLKDNSAFEWDEYESNDNTTTDKNFIASTNLEFPIVSNLNWKAKLGGKFRIKQKERNNSALKYEWDADSDPSTLADNNASQKIDQADFANGILNNYSDLGSGINLDNHTDFVKKNAESVASESDLEDNNLSDYEATEKVYAGYLQTQWQNDQWNVLAGARSEMTDLEFTGRQVDLDAETVSKVTEPRDYLNIFPSIHLTYSPMLKTRLRASFGQSIARPEYFDLVPYALQEDDEIEIGNPDLSPTKSTNLDLSVSQYFKSIGVISAGYYYKWLDDVIYTSTYEKNDFEYTQKRNGNWGEIYGFEFTLNQQFTFLPGAFSGLGIYSNYNLAFSEASVPSRSKVELPGQSKHTANIALSFEQWGFNGRIAYNFHSDFIEELGADSDEDVYYKASSHLDLSLSQQVSEEIQVFVEVSNLTNEPLRLYQGSTKNEIQTEYYGSTATLGVRCDF